MKAIITFLGIFLYAFICQNNKDFVFLYDTSDILLQKNEDKFGITFIINHKENDQNPLTFVYSKTRKIIPDTLKNLSGIELKHRLDLLSIEKEYISKGLWKIDSKTIILFPKWIVSQFKSFYVVEKRNGFFIKYKVNPSDMELDYGK